MKIGEDGIFQAAFVGALLPRFVAILDDKGVINLPFSNAAAVVGWLISGILIAIAAGWAAAKIWKEHDPKQAFFLGLGFLYLINGAAQDGTKIGKALTPASASAQHLAQRVTERSQLGIVVINATIKAPADPKRTVELVLREASTGGIAHEGRTTSFPYILSALPGQYVLEASAPNLVGSKRIDISAGQTATVTVELDQKTEARKFWEGVRQGVFSR